MRQQCSELHNKDIIYEKRSTLTTFDHSEEQVNQKDFKKKEGTLLKNEWCDMNRQYRDIALTLFQHEYKSVT